MFYTRRGGAIQFASMPSGLVSGSPDLDLPWLATRLGGTPVASDRSGFAGVSRVEPGHHVVIGADDIAISDFWKPSTLPFEPFDEQASVELFRSLLRRAVESRIAGDRAPLAAHLSSGYDSSAVAATAALVRKDDQPITAFTSVPPRTGRLAVPAGRSADESELAAATAAALGIDHVLVVDDSSLLQSLRGFARYFQEPVGNPFNHGWWIDIARQSSARGATILLTGEAGNFTISAGGLPALADLLRFGRFARWTTEASAALRRPDVSWQGILYASLRPWLPDRLSNGPPPPATFLHPQFRKVKTQVRRNRPKSYAEARLAGLRSFDPGPATLGSWAFTGVEERDPTNDRRLAEFCLQLPPQALLRDGVYKPLTQAALSDRLPADVLLGMNRGYQGAGWFSRIHPGEVRTAVEEIAESSLASELLDIGALRAAVGEWPSLERRTLDDITQFGRGLTNALAVGLFIVESQGSIVGT